MDRRIQILMLDHCDRLEGMVRSALGADNEAFELSCTAPGSLPEELVSRRWDVVVTYAEGDAHEAEAVVSSFQESRPDLPVIVLGEAITHEVLTNLLHAGAEHVFSSEEMPTFDAMVERIVLRSGERVARERELILHRTRLEDLVAARTQELQRANEELAHEVAARSSAEQALRLSEGRYRSLVESALDGIAVAEGGCIAFANARLAALFSYSPDELIGRPLLDLLAKGERDRFTSLEKDGGSGVFETRCVARTGTEFPAGVSVRALEGEGADTLMVVVRDLTETVQARDALLDRERGGAMELMAEGVAQNFSNIMGVVSGYAASIAESFLPGTQPHRSASRILDATHHAAHLTQQLLNLGKPVDPTTVHVKPTASAEVIRDVLELCSPTLEARRVVVQVKRLDRMPFVFAEAPKLLDVLVNLFFNAADAMPDGGQITVTCHQSFQVRRGNEKGRYAIITVRDEGRGMDREQVEHAFDPFYTTKKDGRSFGLGLPVAQRQVQGWGGWVDLRSAPGKGTRVRVFLRRADALDAVPEGIPRAVLVVDDSRAAVATMSGALEKAGFEVLCAFSGEEALAQHLAHGDRIALSIVDWIMPGMDGQEVLDKLLAEDPNKNVLMVSGFSRDYCRSVLRKGAWGFLQKPFDASELIEAVNARLGGDA